jgi:cytochrome c oxidase subunit 4
MAHEPTHTEHTETQGHAHEETHHPGWSTYWKVALILTLITVWEVWAYYIPSIVASRVFVPMLLVLSALKFGIVVAFYMHLKYDHKLFRALFTGPLLMRRAGLRPTLEAQSAENAESKVV